MGENEGNAFQTGDGSEATKSGAPAPARADILRLGALTRRAWWTVRVRQERLIWRFDAARLAAWTAATNYAAPNDSGCGDPACACRPACTWVVWIDGGADWCAVSAQALEFVARHVAEGGAR